MNKVELTALRRLAEGATPGPWKWSDEYRARDLSDTWSLLGSNWFGILSCDGNGNSPQHINTSNADLIAAANPQAILQLLDYIETMEKDAARYRWLRDACMDDPKTRLAVMNGFIDYETVDYIYGEGMDVAIDAAMQGETE